MQAIRAALAAAPKLPFEPGARGPYDQIMGQVPPPEHVRFEQAEVGGVPGWWAYPEGAGSRAAILYLHGGGYVIGSAGAAGGRIVAASAMSPWIDLGVSSESMETRADQDPILSKKTLADAAVLYLAGRALGDLGAATLEADLSKLPPVRIDVGDAEVLRDDAVRFAERAQASGLTAEVHVWQGMIHVFPSNFAMLQASASALEDIARFLAEHLGTQAKVRA